MAVGHPASRARGSSAVLNYEPESLPSLHRAQIVPINEGDVFEHWTFEGRPHSATATSPPAWRPRPTPRRSAKALAALSDNPLPLTRVSNAPAPARTVFRRNPRAHAGAGGARPGAHGARAAGRGGFLPEAVKTFAGPRRLTLVADGLPPAQSDRQEERKGPRANAPEQAIEGFLRSTGLTRGSADRARRGLFAPRKSRAGRRPRSSPRWSTEIVRNFPWPKSMTWGSGKLRWVRPLQRILCVFDGEVVPFEIDGIASGDLTEGHRFMGARQPFRARTSIGYAEGLRAAISWCSTPRSARTRILDAARTLCFARNLELVEDEGLLDEVAGLAEWPVPILGDMDPASSTCRRR